MPRNQSGIGALPSGNLKLGLSPCHLHRPVRQRAERLAVAGDPRAGQLGGSVRDGTRPDPLGGPLVYHRPVEWLLVGNDRFRESLARLVRELLQWQPVPLW